LRDGADIRQSVRPFSAAWYSPTREGSCESFPYGIRCVANAYTDLSDDAGYEGLPEFDAVAFGVGDPGEAAVVGVFAFGVDGDARGG
jgi:hypothetical protein